MIFLLVVAVIVGFLWYDLRTAYRNTQDYWQARRANVADNAERRISDWLAERTEVAQLVAAHRAVRAALRARQASRRTGAAGQEGLAELTAALDHVVGLYPYAGLYVLDRDAQVVAHSSHSAPLDSSLSETCKAVARAGGLRIEARGDAPDRSLIAFIAPVYSGTPLASSGQTPPQAAGVLLALVDSTQTLFRLLVPETFVTQTADVLLLRREGNDVVCFSPLRHVPESSANMRFPLSTAPLAARLSLEGRDTYLEGSDYRGVPVLAATRHVPSAGWGIVCKIDRDEALASFHRQVRVETLSGILLILLLGGLLSFHRRALMTAMLKEEEGAKFRVLFELAPDAIYMIEPSSLRILARNRKAAEMDGYNDEEIARMTVPDLHPPEERHLLPLRLENPSESGVASPTQTLHHMRKDGKLVPVEESQGPVGVGKHRFWLSVVRDITERKRAEEALEKAAKRFDLVTLATHDAVFDWDLVSHEIWRNENYQRLFGAPERVLDSDNWWLNRLHAEDRERALAAQDAALGGEGELFSSEFRLRRPDGSYADIVERSYIVRDRAGQAVRVIGALTDISARKRAEEALRQSEERYRGLFENSLEGIGLSKGNKIVSANRALLDIFGYSDLQEFKAIPLLEHVAPQSRTLINQIWEKQDRGESHPNRFEYQIIRKNGELRNLEISTERARFGTETYTQSTFRDITERKRAEEALQASEHELALAMDMASLAHWEYDSASRMFTFNDRFYTLYGTTAEREGGYQMSAETYAREFVFPEDTHIVADAQQLATTDPNASWTLEHRIRRRDGEVRHIMVRVSVTKDSRGQTIKARGVNQDITERKEAEEALRAAEEKFRKAFNASPDAIAIRTYPEGRYLEVNDAFLRTGKTSREEVVGKTVAELGIWVNREDLERMHARIERDGRVRDFEGKIRRSNGELGYGVLSAERIDLGGQPCLLIVATDITERKRMEQALKDSEHRYREFISHSIDAVWRFEYEEPIPLDLPEDELLTRFLREGVMAECNDAMGRLYGLSGAEELIGKRLSELPLGSDAGRMESYSSAVHSKFPPRSITFQTTNAAGKRLCLLRTEVPTVQDGKLVRIWGMTRDITDLNLAEEALRESEQRYRTLFENSPVGIYRTTPDGRILAGNPALTQMLGYSSLEEFASRDLNAPDFEPEYSRSRFREQLERDGQVTGLESRWRRRDGNVIFIRENARVIRDDSGQILCYEGTCEDVTERKRAQEDRQRSFEQLRALAARLQSVREEERKRVAREIHDQLGQALTAIKLDLSSLVRGLPAGESPLLEKGMPLLRLVDETIESVRRISTELRPGMLDDLGLAATVEWAAEEFAARTGTKCLLDLAAEQIAVDSETATAVFRIFQETLTNVARHANARQVYVRLAAEGGDLTLVVHDNGKGIDKDELASTSSLGILGMRERALLLGGTLTISGEPGKGTTVRLRIPEVHRA